MYKKSKYLLTNEYNSGLFVMSIRNHKVFHFEKNSEEFDIFQNEILPKNLINEKKFNYLVESKIFIDENVNEFMEVKDEFIKDINDGILKITILPTDGCNFRCTYCYQSEEIHSWNDDIMNRIEKCISNEIEQYRGLMIGWFGGEPLLQKENIIRFMNRIKKICNDKRKSLVSTITTNGYNLDLVTFNKLLNAHVISYQVCIDGLEKRHNTQRPHKTKNDSFNKIVSNLKAIKNECKSMNFTIGIRNNMNTDGFEEIDEYFRFLKEEFGDDKRFTFIFEPIHDWGGERVKDIKDKLILTDEFFSKTLNFAYENKINSLDVFKYTNSFMLCEAPKKNSFIINYDGSIFKCTHAIYDINRSIKNLNTIGKINEQGELEVNSKKELLWTNGENFGTDCNDCKAYPICGGVSCVYAKIKKMNNDLDYCYNKGRLLSILRSKLHIESNELLAKKSKNLIFETLENNGIIISKTDLDEDIQMDSIQYISFLCDFEDKLGFSLLENEDYSKLKTVNDFINLANKSFNKLTFL